jgi:bacitracin transport system ATP-binding protein
MKQRLAIALAIMHDPELLILDEPVNGLDPIGIAEMRSFIRELSSIKKKTILISSHILSEISLLADDIGIIDHGVLLEQESLVNLEEKNGRYLHFIISDPSQAARILEKNFNTKNFTVEQGNSLRIYEDHLPAALLNRTFVENGLEVSEARTCEDSLEDYFRRITGGKGIG